MSCTSKLAAGRALCTAKLPVVVVIAGNAGKDKVNGLNQTQKGKKLHSTYTSLNYLNTLHDHIR